MRRFKSFDIFQKIVIDNEFKSSLTGAFLSISFMLLTIFLLIKETCNYFTPFIVKDSLVQNSLSRTDSSVNLHLKVKFYDSPCPILSLDLENLIGTHIMNIRESVKFSRYSKKTNELIKDEYLPYKIDLLENSLNEGESCIVNSLVKIHKSPGDLHFSFHAFREVYDTLKEKHKNSDIIKKLNLSHKILKFSFLEDTYREKIRNNFSYNASPELKEYFKQLTNPEKIKFPDFENKELQVLNYEYYLKLIPHIFYIESTDESILTYMYTVSYKTKELNVEDEEMPLLMINYDFSPITMKFTLKNKSFLHTLTNICAIVGGVFVIFSILNNFIINFF